MCFLRFSKRKGVADYDLYYFKDKGSMKITSKLEALGRTLLSGAIGWILTKFAYFTSISGPHVAPKENSLKKIYRSEFLQSGFIFVICLLKEVYRKNYERNPFCGQNSIWGSYRDWLLKWARVFKTFSRLFQFAEKVRCRRIFLRLFSWGPHSSLERKRKIIVACLNFPLNVKLGVFTS